jgi:hypothetical protein
MKEKSVTSNSARRPRARSARILFALAALLSGSAAADTSSAQAKRMADCRLESDGTVVFKGKCLFISDGSTGSFSLQNPSGRGPLYGPYLDISVSVIEPGRAEVRGLTRRGVNSRWGEARRSPTEPACWIGTDSSFTVCAFAAAASPPGGRFPFAAKSWGGSVRSGPGSGFKQIASLREREPITVLEQSDAAHYQDRPWFKIQFRGRVGYHWGGIICPVGAAVPGTFEVCN